MINEIIDPKLLPVWVLIIIALLFAFKSTIVPFVVELFAFKNNDVKQLKIDMENMKIECDRIKEELSKTKQHNAAIKGYFKGLENSLLKLDIKLQLPNIEDI